MIADESGPSAAREEPADPAAAPPTDLMAALFAAAEPTHFDPADIDPDVLDRSLLTHASHDGAVPMPKQRNINPVAATDPLVTAGPPTSEAQAIATAPQHTSAEPASIGSVPPGAVSSAELSDVDSSDAGAPPHRPDASPPREQVADADLLAALLAPQSRRP